MKRLFIAYLTAGLLWQGCTPKRSPIEYGLDKCHFCTMAIIDQRFGCELVTVKGKVYKFDATECMIHFIESDQINVNEISMLLTNTFDKPGELIHVDHCYFLQSENMPSPMGMFINPFSEKNLAMEFQKSRNGSLFQWDDLKDQLEIRD